MRGASKSPTHRGDATSVYLEDMAEGNPVLVSARHPHSHTDNIMTDVGDVDSTGSGGALEEAWMTQLSKRHAIEGQLLAVTIKDMQTPPTPTYDHPFTDDGECVM